MDIDRHDILLGIVGIVAGIVGIDAGIVGIVAGIVGIDAGIVGIVAGIGVSIFAAILIVLIISLVISRVRSRYRSSISGLPPEYEALIECESEEMDIEKPDHIVKRLKDDLGYIEQKQKQRAEYELTQDGCDILDCQELGQKLKHAGYVQLDQTGGDNNTFEITEEGQKIIERNGDVCEVLKDDLEYIEQKQKQKQEYELTKHGHPVAIKSRQRIEKTNLNLYVIALSALGIGFSLVVSTDLSIFALFTLVGVLLIILPLARSKAWTR